jgi:hypothetical protein
MTYNYYKHTIESTKQDGTKYYTDWYTNTGTWVNPYPSNGSVCITTEELTTNNQSVVLNGYQVLLLGTVYVIDEEHTGKYVINKDAWDEAATKYNYDNSLKAAVYDWDWDEYNEYTDSDEDQNDGQQYVVLDYGGQLLLKDSDSGYTETVEEVANELPWDGVNWDYSDVGNG